MTSSDLTIRHNAFVADMLIHGDQTRAYRSAFDCGEMTDKMVSTNASRLMKQQHIAAAIAGHKKTVVERAMITVIEVMQEFVDIATAEPSKIIQNRKHCCRYCHGVGFNYQWRNEDEWCKAVLVAQQFNAKKSAKVAPQEIPSDAGGFGYNVRKGPHEECPHCIGIGIDYIWVADTRHLTGKEKRLFAGIKQTPNGVQILMRDQDAALKNLASIMGMFVERVQLGGEGGGPITAMQLPNDPVEASRVYQSMIKSRNASN